MYLWINDENGRYYHAHLTRDLFGAWTLVASWGSRESRRGGGKRTSLPSLEAAQARLREIDRRRTRHGYRRVEGELPGGESAGH